jgi:phosphatidylethanolamine/phosphatidyl-N-methylethanolamine N-methyltransferase
MRAPPQRKKTAVAGFGDGETFLRRFLDDPKRTGAVAPSSPFLAREMARAVDPQTPGLIVELGPGTGPVTKALIARGVRRENLLLVEFDPFFCKLLAERFARTRVVRADAFALRAALGGRLTQPVAAVVSSLPLLNEPPERRLRLLDEAFELMGLDGLFVQFTYGLRSPIPREACAGKYLARCGAPVLRNLPPASVWTYRRRGRVFAPEPGIARLIAEAERFGARLAERGKATELMLSRQGDRMKEMLKREAAAFGRKRPEDRL